MKWIKVKKKPVEVEAFQLTEDMLSDNYGEDKYLIGEYSNWLSGENCIWANNQFFQVMTLEGGVKANVGDYIIKGVNSGVYPCREDIFKKTYEVLE